MTTTNLGFFPSSKRCAVIGQHRRLWRLLTPTCPTHRQLKSCSTTHPWTMNTCLSLACPSTPLQPRNSSWVPILGQYRKEGCPGESPFAKKARALIGLWLLISVQTISGTGANHLGALFLSRFYNWNGPKVVYLSDPTWGRRTSYFVR
jgi:hypothetical protein